jgi:hypothetical protein
VSDGEDKGSGVYAVLTDLRSGGRMPKGNKGGTMARMMADCRRFPSETNCSLVIIGEEDEVIRAASEHAVSVHGHEDSPQLRAELREFLEPAEAYSPGPRAQETMPG